jgi:hypothetical protein
MDEKFKELNDLHTVHESLIKDEEMIKQAKEFKRLFSVLMLQVKYCAKTSKFQGKFTNRRIMMGPSENINAVKAMWEDKLKGSFHVDACVTIRENQKNDLCCIGHKLEYRTTSGYPAGCCISCDSCGKGVKPEDGHYHCAPCYEDYHKDCLKMDSEFKEKFEKEQLENKEKALVLSEEKT